MQNRRTGPCPTAWCRVCPRWPTAFFTASHLPRQPAKSFAPPRESAARFSASSASALKHLIPITGPPRRRMADSGGFGHRADALAATASCRAVSHAGCELVRPCDRRAGSSGAGPAILTASHLLGLARKSKQAGNAPPVPYRVTGVRPTCGAAERPDRQARPAAGNQPPGPGSEPESPARIRRPVDRCRIRCC